MKYYGNDLVIQGLESDRLKPVDVDTVFPKKIYEPNKIYNHKQGRPHTAVKRISEDGEEKCYDSVSQAARLNGKATQHINKLIRLGNVDKEGYRWERI